ncbi:hypothetical protein F5Y18DRAFT_163516 [Xylariaceae sp. FL1019]|nr:hypothetical protein F5Y18DRAFT_163516 [Xylariaceae sp. FL1019]
MAEYATLKVPELKKLLQEKELTVSGNKAELVARLQEHDKASTAAEEDVIDYSDDDEPVAKPTESAPAPAEEKPAEPVVATELPTVTPTEAPAEPVAELVAEPKAEPAAATEAKGESKPEEEAKPKVDFSAHLPASTADEETRKRAERAKRFGVAQETDEEAKKKEERAARFGTEADTTVVSGLDSALPEKRERKRGREGNTEGGGDRGAKRQQNGDRRQGGRFRGRGGSRRGNDRGAPAPRKEGGGNEKPRRILDDPSEKAKADARAKRFGGGA